MNSRNTSATGSRRDFLKTSTLLAAGTAVAGAVTRPGYAAEKNTIKIALVGCGGRGTGAAAQALSTQGPTQLWALADVFDAKVQSTLGQLKPRFEKQIAVPAERQFAGFDAYRKAIDSLDRGDIVLLATAPAFRPIHFAYAVEKGVNVFMEKSFAVDAPGIRQVLRTGEAAAARNLKVAGGLMSRHNEPLAEAIGRIHDGAIGDVITAWAYRMHGPVGLAPKPAGRTELGHQITNYSNFTWLNGSFIVDWLIHNIDICCWTKGAYPVSVQGMGGRQVRTDADQLFDHYFAEYTFPDGTRLAAQGRHMANAFGFFGDKIEGTTGCAILGEGISRPRLFKGHNPTSENVLWQYKGPEFDAYQREHDLLFAAIRNNEKYNETERCAKSCFTAIMGRMAVESGQEIRWEDAFNSTVQVAAGIERLKSLDDPAPVMPGVDGKYPVASPGTTKVI